MRLNITLLLIMVALVLALGFTAWAYLDACANYQRVSANQNILLHNGKVEISEIAGGKSLISAPALTLKNSEFRQSGDTLNKIAKSMGIKPARITGAATVSAVTAADVFVPLIHPDTAGCDTAGAFSFADSWLEVSGTVRPDTAAVGLHFISRDTLDIIVHRIPKRFLIFRFGCKAVKMNISSRNPHTQLIYARYYQLVD